MMFREIIVVYSKNNTDNMNEMCHQNAEFLDTLAEMGKATISFAISVRLSVLLSTWNNSAPTRRIFKKMWYLIIFSKIWRENSRSIKIGHE
jgi:hypothetical protein